MLYKLVNESTTYTYDQLVQLFPSTYIPPSPSKEYLQPLGVERVRETDKPSTTYTQIAEVTGITQIDNQWWTVWTVRDLTPAELAAKEAERLATPLLVETFIKRFTKAEIKKIRTLCTTDKEVDWFMYMLSFDYEMSKTAQKTTDFMAAIVAGGCITQDRVAIILD